MRGLGGEESKDRQEDKGQARESKDEKGKNIRPDHVRIKSVRQQKERNDESVGHTFSRAQLTDGFEAESRQLWFVEQSSLQVRVREIEKREKIITIQVFLSADNPQIIKETFQKESQANDVKLTSEFTVNLSFCRCGVESN